jgi:hypothetical protein
MKKCSYCGFVNEENAENCVQCGQSEFSSAAPVNETEFNSNTPKEKGFFRISIASKILLLAVLASAFFVLLDTFLARMLMQKGKSPRLFLWGAFWSAAIAILCAISRQSLMVENKLEKFSWVPVLVALLINVRNWLVFVSLHRHFPLTLFFEPLLIWLPLLYVVCAIYFRNRRILPP